MSEIKQNLLQDDIRTKFLFYLQRNSIKEEKPIIKSPHMLTIKELSKKTALSEYCIRKLCKEGKISYIRSGTKYLINYEKFIDYLDGKK